MTSNKRTIRRAVILAAGRGTRLQAGADQPGLADDVRAAAEAGLKQMLPILGRAYIDYVLDPLVRAGLRELCFVVRPGRTALHDHIEALAAAGGLNVQLVDQPQPCGTADALTRAEPFVAGEPFVMINSDNVYPREAIDALCRAGEPSLIGFAAGALARGNIAADRLGSFATLQVDAQNRLVDIVEKPGLAPAEDAMLSMNCWRFDADIFAACRAVTLSPRGEYELPDAVRRWQRDTGRSMRVIACDEPVLDLTALADIPALEGLLDPAALALPQV